MQHWRCCLYLLYVLVPLSGIWLLRQAWGSSVCVWRWPLCTEGLLVDRSCREEGVEIGVRKSAQDISFKLKSPTEHSQSPVFPLLVRSNLLESRGGKITCWYVCSSKQTLNISYNCPSRVFVPWQRTTHALLCGPVSVGSRRGERSQHHFQTGRNMLVEHSWGRRPPNRREHLHKRCQSKWLITAEDVLWKVNSALTALLSPQSLNPRLCAQIPWSIQNV